MSRIPWILLSTLALCACAASKAPAPPQHIATFHPDGKPRTEFFLRKGRVDSTVTLFDRQGKPRAQAQPRGRKVESVYLLSYPGLADAGGSTSLKSIYRFRDFETLLQQLSLKYQYWFAGGVSGEATYVLWVNGQGGIEHVVCTESFHVPVELMATLVAEMENWQVTPPSDGQGFRIRRKLLFGY